jgi:hypothetical protein
VCSGIACLSRALQSIIGSILTFCDVEAVAILKSLIHRGDIRKPVSDDWVFPDVTTFLDTPAIKRLMVNMKRNDPARRLLPFLLCAALSGSAKQDMTV